MIMKLQESNGRFWVTVPLTKVKVKKWQKGQELDWSYDKHGNLVLIEI